MAKILLVEDDNNLREIYEARLQAEGYDIVSARDGEEALTIAMKERPDLIISDVMMPKISGFDMLDIIRSTEETKNAKVIMMTALSQAEDKERATKLGADRYLVKSQVTLEDVAKVAREVLSGESDQNNSPAQDIPAVAQISSTPAPSEPAIMAISPADDPIVATPEPAALTDPVIVAPVPEPAVVTATPDPSTSIVADDPAATIIQNSVAAPVTDTVVSPSPGLSAIAPAQDEVETSDYTESMEQSVENEQSAIAAQIESFINAKKPETVEPEAQAEPVSEPVAIPEPAIVEAPEPVVVEVVAPTPVPVPAPEQVQEVQTDASETVGQKIIQPLSDPTASKSSELNKLLEQEEEREKMEEIAKSVVAENTAPEPAFIETPTPIIPHSNGNSIDGVTAPLNTGPAPVHPEPKTNESADPENIAL